MVVLFTTYLRLEMRDSPNPRKLASRPSQSRRASSAHNVEGEKTARRSNPSSLKDTALHMPSVS